MPSRAAVVRIGDLNESEKKDISKILQNNIKYFTKETKERVLEFLGFLERNDESEIFSLRCKEIRDIEEQVSELKDVNYIIKTARGFRGHKFKAPNTNRISIAIRAFIRNEAGFEILVDKVSVIEYLTYHDFLDIVNSNAFREIQDMDFYLVKRLIAKLENPSKSKASRKIGLQELDIIVRSALSDKKSGDQSKYLLQLAEIFGIIPDIEIMTNIGIIEKRTH